MNVNNIKTGVWNVAESAEIGFVCDESLCVNIFFKKIQLSV